MSILASRITPKCSERVCGRCGRGMSPNKRADRDPEREKFCVDCLPEATRLGWCPPTAHQQRLANLVGSKA